jgi:hypothetical protein
LGCYVSGHVSFTVCGLLQDVRFCPLDDQRLENTLCGEEKTKCKISNSLHVAPRYSRPLHLNKIINWPSRLRSPVGLPKTSTLAALPFSNHCKLYRHFRALLLSFQLRRSAQTLLRSSGASISLAPCAHTCPLHLHLQSLPTPNTSAPLSCLSGHSRLAMPLAKTADARPLQIQVPHRILEQLLI